MPEGTVNVRYMVHDVDAAVEFYTKHFGFTVGTHAAPAFADVFRGNLRLLLSGPSSSAGRPMPDGKQPGPGGWNRVEFVVDDIEAEVERLRAEGVPFSETTSSPVRGASRSCSRIHPATRSSCSAPLTGNAPDRDASSRLLREAIETWPA